MLEVSFVIGMHRKADLTSHSASLLWANATVNVAAAKHLGFKLDVDRRSRSTDCSSHIDSRLISVFQLGDPLSQAGILQLDVARLRFVRFRRLNNSVFREIDARKH